MIVNGLNLLWLLCPDQINESWRSAQNWGQKSAKNTATLWFAVYFVTISTAKYCIKRHFPRETEKSRLFIWTPRPCSHRRCPVSRTLQNATATNSWGNSEFHMSFWKPRGKQLEDKETKLCQKRCFFWGYLAEVTWISHLDGPCLDSQDGLLQRPPHGEVEWRPTAFGIKLWGFWEDCQGGRSAVVQVMISCGRNWSSPLYRQFHSESGQTGIIA